MPSDKDDRSITQLLGDLTSEATLLVRQEVELAKAEMLEKITQLGTAAATLTVGGLIVFAGFLVSLDAAVYGLGKVLEPYGLSGFAALIVAFVTMIVGGIVLAIGRSALKAGNLTPTRTAQSLRRDRQLIKEQVR